jgi:hypothetical protein
MIAEFNRDRQSVSMSPPFRPLLVLTLLLITAHRSPAPISEESTPRPKQASTPRPKPKVESTPRPNRSLAGNWAGTTSGTNTAGTSYQLIYSIKISDDEKTVWLRFHKPEQEPVGPGYQAPCNRFGETLTWTLTFPASTCTDTFRLNSDGTAIYVSEGSYTSDDTGYTFKETGTFTKNGAFVATAAASPPTTEAVAPVAQPTPQSRKGGLPVAQAVPNKPGYVYNPFDPTSKILVNVGGIRSGSKAREPTSGKLFIVP